jgi:histidinol dehydrogenase
MKLLSGEEAAQAVASLAHRYASFDPAVEKTVAGIVNQVRTGGDPALLDYAQKCACARKSCRQRWAW